MQWSMAAGVTLGATLGKIYRENLAWAKYEKV
jgi:hypothetical protein